MSAIPARFFILELDGWDPTNFTGMGAWAEAKKRSGARQKTN